MPIMKNISERRFVIAGKDLDKGQEGEFAQSVIDRHVADYKGELVQVDSRKEEEKPVTSQKEPETEVKAEEIPVIDVVVENKEPQVFEGEVEITVSDAPQEPKKRGPKPKNKE